MTAASRMSFAVRLPTFTAPPLCCTGTTSPQYRGSRGRRVDLRSGGSSAEPPLGRVPGPHALVEVLQRGQLRDQGVELLLRVTELDLRLVHRLAERMGCAAGGVALLRLWALELHVGHRLGQFVIGLGVQERLVLLAEHLDAAV